MAEEAKQNQNAAGAEAGRAEAKTDSAAKSAAAEEANACGSGCACGEGKQSGETKQGFDAKETGASEKSGAQSEAGREKAQQSSDGTQTGDGKGKADASAKPDAKDRKIEELTDKYKRLFAEFDNFRKRSENEKAGMFGEGERTVLLKILPVIDNFERAQQSVPEELKGSAYVEGMNKIYRSFTDSLKELGVQPIEASGKTFDANLHNAVMHVEDENADENVVVEEFQKGYLFRDKVLRHSMVKVAN